MQGERKNHLFCRSGGAGGLIAIWINLKLTIILGMGAVTLQWSLHVVLPICLVVIESWSPHFKYDFPLDPFREELDGPRVKKHSVQ